MRMFFKVILFPISLILTFFVSMFTFLVERVAGLLNIFSIIIFFAALIAYSQFFFGWPYSRAGNNQTLITAICGTVFAFVLSPYGLPTVMMWVLEKLDDRGDVIKDI